MITKQQLKDYRSLMREIQDLDMELSSMYGLRERKLSSGSKTSAVTDLSVTVDKIEKLANLIKEKRDNLLQERVKIEEAIEGLSPNERLIIRMRYIQGLNWLQIQMRLERSERWVFKYHSLALKKFF